MNVSHTTSLPPQSAVQLDRPTPNRNGAAKPEGAGKSDQSPAFRARALIAGDPSQQQGTFGALVSSIAKDGDKGGE